MCKRELRGDKKDTQRCGDGVTKDNCGSHAMGHAWMDILPCDSHKFFSDGAGGRDDEMTRRSYLQKIPAACTVPRACRAAIFGVGVFFGVKNVTPK